MNMEVGGCLTCGFHQRKLINGPPIYLNTEMIFSFAEKSCGAERTAPVQTVHFDLLT